MVERGGRGEKGVEKIKRWPREWNETSLAAMLIVVFQRNSFPSERKFALQRNMQMRCLEEVEEEVDGKIGMIKNEGSGSAGCSKSRLLGKRSPSSPLQPRSAESQFVRGKNGQTRSEGEV